MDSIYANITIEPWFLGLLEVASAYLEKSVERGEMDLEVARQSINETYWSGATKGVKTTFVTNKSEQK